MRQTYSISFYCRESKVSKKTGLANAEMSVCINGKRTYISLPLKLKPSEFKKKMDSKRGNDIKEFCSIYYTKVNNAIMSLVREDKIIDINLIKNIILCRQEKKLTVLDAWNEYLKKLSVKVDVDMQLSTFKKYMLTKDYFCRCVGNDTPLDSINGETIQNIYTKLRKEKSINTAEKYMTKIKSFFRNFGITDIFNDIKVVKEKKDIILFTDDDYNKIKNSEFLYPHLNKMRDIFIFCCGSGISYSDLRELKSDDFKIDDDGTVTVTKKRHKTGVKFYSVILPDAVAVLKKYNFNLDIMSNQVGNKFLHIIEGICGVNAPLTFHRCRHYYATKLIKSGVDATIVQKCLGHSSLKMTLGIYTHLVEADVKKGVMSKI